MSNEYKDWIRDSLNDALVAIDVLIETLLKVSPEHKEWVEQNFKEYLDDEDSGTTRSNLDTNR